MCLTQAVHLYRSHFYTATLECPLATFHENHSVQRRCTRKCSRTIPMILHHMAMHRGCTGEFLALGRLPAQLCCERWMIFWRLTCWAFYSIRFCEHAKVERASHSWAVGSKFGGNLIHWFNSDPYPYSYATGYQLQNSTLISLL